MNLPTITMGQICKRGPCTDPLQYANKNWSGTALQVLRHPRISAKHKLWVVLHESALPREMLVEAVCQFAERALSALPADKVDKAARAYMRGEITREELTDAARAARVADAASAARAARVADAASAARAARAAEAARAAAPATATAWAAAWAAAEAAEVARAAEQKEQVKILVRLCKDYENN